ncbi:uncharacterized protein [Neodiprion pinetum]|uniref:uncharacterized protein n=1 Tax=Neodiprion pinetum TaxID=441929 RepID=UPI001EE1181E|nr:uncharacterized protein LOC124221877 [Neodiprion pinetum]
MSMTTGDPSTLKTPPTLSGGDLVSRLLAATPPYLYNVPLTPHSFFFSEMLRSFVQAKAEASSVGSGPPPPPRRRKRSWRDARDGRDRPLELTTKERPHEKYFGLDGHLEHKGKHLSIQHPSLGFENKTTTFGEGGAKIPEDHLQGKQDFCRHKNYFDERQSFGSNHLASSQSPETCFPVEQKVKPEELPGGDQKLQFNERNSVENPAKSSGETGFASDHPKNKLEFSPRNFPSSLAARSEALANPQNFGLASDAPNPDFLPAPMWYPPYPMPQSYPGIDPLHFFIDLRVSGHIWDRKLQAERQPSFKSKHTSAFNVPQSKEYNRPLNLTRDEASSSRTKDENSKGTHYILKNLTKTYKGIRGADKTLETSRILKSGEEIVTGEASGRPRSADANQSENKNDDKKDIRALIGLELVVDYVKDPKDAAGGKNSPEISE